MHSPGSGAFAPSSSNRASMPSSSKDWRMRSPRALPPERMTTRQPPASQRLTSSHMSFVRPP